MEKAKKTVLIFFIISILLCIGFNRLYHVAVFDFKTRHLLITISTCFYFLLYPSLYLTILFYDLDGRTLKRTKILHYVMLLLSVSIFIYGFFFDVWAIVFAMYFLFAAIGNLLVIALLKKTYLKEQDISLKREWYSLLVWIVLVAIVFLIPKDPNANY